jgi:hypothetical protein
MVGRQAELILDPLTKMAGAVSLRGGKLGPTCRRRRARNCNSLEAPDRYTSDGKLSESVQKSTAIQTGAAHSFLPSTSFFGNLSLGHY